jgi:hypothetical protein
MIRQSRPINLLDDEVINLSCIERSVYFASAGEELNVIKNSLWGKNANGKGSGFFKNALHHMYMLESGDSGRIAIVVSGSSFVAIQHARHI